MPRQAKTKTIIAIKFYGSRDDRLRIAALARSWECTMSAAIRRAIRLSFEGYVEGFESHEKAAKK